MKAILRRNTTDRQMIDLMTEDGRHTNLWAVLHEDFVWGEKPVKDLIAAGKEVTVNITIDDD